MDAQAQVPGPLGRHAGGSSVYLPPDVQGPSAYERMVDHGAAGQQIHTFEFVRPDGGDAGDGDCDGVSGARDRSFMGFLSI